MAGDWARQCWWRFGMEFIRSVSVTDLPAHVRALTWSLALGPGLACIRGTTVAPRNEARTTSRTTRARHSLPSCRPRQVKVEVTIAPAQGDSSQQQHQTLIGLSAGFGASLPATAAAALNLTVAAASPALACPANHSDASGVRRDEQVSVALPARSARAHV